MLWPKKNSYKEFDNEKKFLRLENSPPPPITFLMVRPLGEGMLGVPVQCTKDSYAVLTVEALCVLSWLF